METFDIAEYRRTRPTVSRRRRRSRFRLSAGHAFVAPYVIFLVAFGIGPTVYTTVLMFSTFTDADPALAPFGFQNFERVFNDFRFVGVFENLARFLIVSIPVAVILVPSLALLLHSKKSKYHAVLRTLYFLPAATAGIPAILLAIFMLDPLVSPFGPLYELFGMERLTDVVNEASMPIVLTLIAIFAAGLWVNIFYGALGSIPPTVTDAARVDGANEWRIARHIKLPHLYPYVIYMTVLVIAANVQLIAEPLLLRSAKVPGLPATWSPNELAYNFAFKLGDLGASAVLSMMLLAIGAFAAAIVLKFTDFFRIDS